MNQRKIQAILSYLIHRGYVVDDTANDLESLIGLKLHVSYKSEAEPRNAIVVPTSILETPTTTEMHIGEQIGLSGAAVIFLFVKDDISQTIIGTEFMGQSATTPCNIVDITRK